MTKHRRRIGLGFAAASLLGLCVYAAFGGPQHKTPTNEAARQDAAPPPADKPEPGGEFKLHPDEPAAAVLEFQEDLGSVTDGTLFAGDEVLWDNDRGKVSKPQAVAELVRGWERERRRQAALHPDTPPAWPDLSAPPVADGRVESLRSVGEQLDEAANRLERQGLYQRADQLRELAQQLRLDARGPIAEPAPEPDFKTSALPTPAVPAQEPMPAAPVQQVLLHTKFIEVSRTKLRKLGIDWANVGRKDCSVARLLTHRMANQRSGEPGSFDIIDDSESFLRLLEALRQNKVAKVLAEPSLVTASGRPASFRSGGEFPIVVPQGPEKAAIEYRRFGTEIEFLPTILANGNIHLEFHPQISEIDTGRAVKLGNFTVPGLRVRRMDTVAELRPGQTLAMGGLVQTSAEDKTEDGANDEIELLIVVTPELISPLEYTEIPPGGPGPLTQRPPEPQSAPSLPPRRPAR